MTSVRQHGGTTRDEAGAVATSEPSAPPAPDDFIDRRRHTWWWIVAIALVPLAVSAIDLLFFVRGKYRAAGDYASIELLTRDVLRHPPLIGLFSRGRWHHPGPAFFYVLAVPYRLLGGKSADMDVGALVVNGAAISVMAWVARRRGGTALMLLLLVGVGLFAHSAGPEFMRSPWNPRLPVLAYALLILLTWCALCGDRWAFPAVVGLASFVIQTHVGYVVLAVPLVVVSAIALLPVARRGPDERRSVLWAALVGAGVFVVMWLPPAIDQLTNRPGNLRRVIRYFRHPGESTRTVTEGWNVVTGQFAWPPEWAHKQIGSGFLMGQDPHAFTSSRPVLLVLFVLAGLYALWRGRAGARWLFLLLLMSLFLGVVAVARTVGLIEAYRLQWTWVLAMLALVATGWMAWTAAVERWSWLHARVFVPACVVALVLLTVANSADVVRAGTPEPMSDFPDTMRVLDEQLMTNLPDGKGVVVVREPDIDFPYWVPGVMLALERRGISARVEGDSVRLVGNHRTYRGEPVRATLTIKRFFGRPETPPGTRPVAVWSRCPLDVLARQEKSKARLEERWKNGELSNNEYLSKRARFCSQYAVAIYAEGQ